MTNESIRKYRKAEPFRPFEIELVTGRILVVKHPEYVSAPPVRSGEFVFWGADGVAESLNGALVVAGVRLHPNGQGKNGKHRKER